MYDRRDLLHPVPRDIGKAAHCRALVARAAKAGAFFRVDAAELAYELWVESGGMRGRHHAFIRVNGAHDTDRRLSNCALDRLALDQVACEGGSVATQRMCSEGSL